MFEGTPGVSIGEDDGLVGIQDFGGFRHEMNSAEGDDFGIGFLSFISEAEGVADVIGNILDGADLVIMGKNDGVLLLFEAKNIFLEIKNGRVGHVGSFWD